MNHAHEKNFKIVHGQQSPTTIRTTEDAGTGQQLFNNYVSPEIIFRVFEENGNFAFDFNPYEERSTSSLAYTNHKIKLHLATVLANEPLGFDKPAHQCAPNVTQRHLYIAKNTLRI